MSSYINVGSFDFQKRGMEAFGVTEFVWFGLVGPRASHRSRLTGADRVIETYVSDISNQLITRRTKLNAYW